MAAGAFSSGGPVLTETEATWLPPKGITVAGQRRNRTGLRSASAPGRGPGRSAILPERSRRNPVVGIGGDEAHYRRRMKKLALLLLAVALVALLASLKFKKGSAAPAAPEGSWELADDEATA